MRASFARQRHQLPYALSGELQVSCNAAYRGLLLRLARVEGVVGGVKFAVEAPRPDDFATVVKRLSKGL